MVVAINFPSGCLFICLQYNTLYYLWDFAREIVSEMDAICRQL